MKWFLLSLVISIGIVTCALAQSPPTLPWTVISPTNTSADVATLQNAVNGANPVMMMPGTWQICSQVTMPANQTLSAQYISSNPGSLANSDTYSKTIVKCPTNGTFSAGQAFIAMKDHDVLRGIDFKCNFGASPLFNGINALNATAVEIDHNSVYFCKEGISRFSDGAVAGFTVNYSQLARIHDNLIYQATDYGIYADATGGGFVSDEQYGPNNDITLSTNGQILLRLTFGTSVFGNRVEDAVSGIIVSDSFDVLINGNMCDKITCVKISNSNGVAVTGNYGDYGTGGNNFGALHDVEFSGANVNIQFAGNTWQNIIVYSAAAGATFSGASFAELPSTGTAIFADAFTQGLIQPLMMANNQSVGQVAPPITLTDSGGLTHISSRGFTPILSSCGTSPSVAGDDTAGTITTGTGSPTACTVTFAAAYPTAPVCTPTTNLTTSVPAVTAISATAFTVSLSATATRIYYQCQQQVSNLLTGGVGFTSVWSGTRATLATAQAAGPDGTTTAAKITEDATASNNHLIAENVTAAAGTYTYSTYLHAGTAGSDGIAIVVEDSAFTNIAGAAFSNTGVYLGSILTAGNGAVISAGSQALTGGWFRVWMTFSMVAAPAFEFIFLTQGASNVFSGNSTNNVLVWGPAMRAGTLP